MSALSAPYFHDEAAAFAELYSVRVRTRKEAGESVSISAAF